MSQSTNHQRQIDRLLACFRRHLPAVAVIAVCIWVARYFHISSFGLYEDDFMRIPGVLELGWSELWPKIEHQFRYNIASQGRPLHPSLIFLFSWLGWKTGGLTAIYLAGYGILLLNGVLLYALLTRLGAGRHFVLGGTFAYCLYTADTTQIFLTMTLGGQPALTLLLLAFHLHLTRWRWLSYLPAVLALLCYETVLPVFLVAPLLTTATGRQLRRNFVSHAVAVAALFGMVAWWRAEGSDIRLAGLDPAAAVLTSFRQMALGPLTVLRATLVKPVAALGDLPSGPLLAVPILPALCALLHRRDPAGEPSGRSQRIRLALAGAISLILAYPIAFTIPASVLTGRDTRVHLAAAFGIALLAGAACSFLYSRSRSRWWRACLTAALALFFTGAMFSGFRVQRDYAAAWQHQRDFWTATVRLCPDITNDTLILADTTTLPASTEIYEWSFYYPWILRDIYELPEPLTQRPRLYMTQWGWRDRVTATGDLFDAINLGADPPSFLEPFRDGGEIIFLEMEGGELLRRTGVLEVGDRSFPLKQPGAPLLPGLRRKPLHALLIQ